MIDRSQLLNDPEQALRLALDDRQASTWTAIPGIVQSVDFSEMTCSVQPSIQGTIYLDDGTIQNVNYPLLIHVPIIFPSAGGFTITLPLAQGDEVLVIFSSRCIDSWWQNGGYKNVAMEDRMHDLSDGFAIPGPKSQPKKISGISSTGAQIRNDAGTSYIEISADGKIKVVSPVEIDLTGNVVVSGTLSVGGIIVSSAAGLMTVAGNLKATGEVTAGTTPLHTHVHGGVTTGSGSTGGPVP